MNDNEAIEIVDDILSRNKNKLNDKELRALQRVRDLAIPQALRVAQQKLEKLSGTIS